jgi:hypothetical protein
MVPRLLSRLIDQYQISVFYPLKQKERHLMELKRLLEGVSPIAKLIVDSSPGGNRSVSPRRRKSKHGVNSSESHVNFEPGHSISCKSELSIPNAKAKGDEDNTV